jgi:hypothetical protein
MPVPECSPSEPASPLVEDKPPIITRNVLQSYLLCKLKGHLKLMGERGSPCDYETLMTELRATLAKEAAEKLAVRPARAELSDRRTGPGEGGSREARRATG